MHAVIVGAGVAGLTIAYQLTRQGYRTTIVEKNDTVGGLARTFHYGNFHFDVGPHRFHTENRRVADFIRAILGEEAIEIPRKSGARMFGRFHEWPLRPGILASMPFSLMLRGARDLVFKERLPGESFEADVVNKYGRTLYEIFFKPYTRKFLFYSPEQLHRDWARAGVNRAVIDQRAGSDNLWSLLKNTLMPRPVETMFLYPPHGVGRFSDLLAEGIGEMGGRLRLGRSVKAVETARGRITGIRTEDEHIPCDQIVWTAPLTTLNGLVGVHGIDLEYLSTIFYNLEIGKPGQARLPVDLFRRRRDLLAGDGAGGVPAARPYRPARAGSASSSPAAKVTSAGNIPSATPGDDRGPGTGTRHRSRGPTCERVHIERGPVHLSDLQAELPRRADAKPQGRSPATRTCCWPAAADASGTTTWITRSARA